MDKSSPTNIDDSVAHLAELHRAHERSTTPFQRAANNATRLLGRPATLALFTLIVAAWVGGNYLVERSGATPFEDFPFPGFEIAATIAAVLIALLILTTQQHQDQLAERRAELTLQIAIMSEQKVAKVIALLEEQRRENPMLSSRVDEEAEAMAKSIDPGDSLRSLEQAI